jgi:hypothetical protein
MPAVTGFTQSWGGLCLTLGQSSPMGLDLPILVAVSPSLTICRGKLFGRSAAIEHEPAVTDSGLGDFRPGEVSCSLVLFSFQLSHPYYSEGTGPCQGV